MNNIGTQIGVTARAPVPFYYRRPAVKPTNTTRAHPFSPAVVARLQRLFAEAVAAKNYGEMVRLGAMFERWGIPRTPADAIAGTDQVGVTFPPAVVARLQRLFAEAVATKNYGEMVRLGGMLERWGIPRTPAVSGNPGSRAAVGDVVRRPYRYGDVVANDVLVTSADAETLRGTVGGVVYADGRVNSWWSDAARMAAGARVPATVPRRNVQHVWRNGRLLI